MLTNGLLLSINIYYLMKIYRTKEDFDLVEFKRDDQLVRKYVAFYESDIRNYFPKFSMDEMESGISFVVLRDLAFANIFVANISSDGSAFVKVNYTVLKYRDFEVGKFIFEKEKKYLLSKGVRQIVYDDVRNNDHLHFLKVMGFTRELKGNKAYYIKNLH